MRWPSVVPALLLTVLAACGGGGGGEGSEGVVGRVMSSVEGRVCVSPDRGETETCLDVPFGEGTPPVEVGECAEVVDGTELRLIPEAACAAGDLGD